MEDPKITPPVETLDDIFNDIGYHRLKGETDDAFRRRVANRVDEEEWVDIAKKAQRRLREIIDGTGPDSDATEMAAIRTALERADGEPTRRVQLSGPDGGPIEFSTVPVTEDQLQRFLKRHAKSSEANTNG